MPPQVPTAEESPIVRYLSLVSTRRARADVILVQKPPMTRPAPKLASKPLDPLSKLPSEIVMVIARFYLLSSSNTGYVPAVLPLTHVSRRLRQIVIGSPDLWASFKISDNKNSFRFARLCIERSSVYPLNIQLHAYISEEGSDLGDCCFNVLHPVASRIQIFEVYMIGKESISIGKSVLVRLVMPTLKQIGIRYCRMKGVEPIQGIEIPGGGANIQSLSLMGFFPTDSNLSNLKSLTLKSSQHCKWSLARISALLTESPALENLTFLATLSAFEIEDDLIPSTITSASLLYLAMKDMIGFDFTSKFLLGLHAPNLETVHVSLPLLRVNELFAGTHILWNKIADQVEKRFLRRKETFEKVRSLVLDPGGSPSSPYCDLGFFRFLMAAFPRINSLDLDRKHIEVLGICNGKGGSLEAGWASINQLTIHGDPSHHVLDHILAFVCFRNTNGYNLMGEDEEDSGDEHEGEEDDDELENEGDEVEDDQDTESQDDDQEIEIE
ncbi:hypothetical protein FRC01_009836 [Tulasnella sp. 417]|nr:hypothetical protein FRC01_009836 [Tulasnella sp. 417]